MDSKQLEYKEAHNLFISNHLLKQNHFKETTIELWKQ